MYREYRTNRLWGYFSGITYKLYVENIVELWLTDWKFFNTTFILFAQQVCMYVSVVCSFIPLDSAAAPSKERERDIHP